MDFRPDRHTHVAARLTSRLAHQLDPARMIAVLRDSAHHIDAGARHVGQHRRIVRGGTQGCDYLGAPKLGSSSAALLKAVFAFDELQEGAATRRYIRNAFLDRLRWPQACRRRRPEKALLRAIALARVRVPSPLRTRTPLPDHSRIVPADAISTLIASAARYRGSSRHRTPRRPTWHRPPPSRGT